MQHKKINKQKRTYKTSKGKKETYSYFIYLGKDIEFKENDLAYILTEEEYKNISKNTGTDTKIKELEEENQQIQNQLNNKILKVEELQDQITETLKKIDQLQEEIKERDNIIMKLQQENKEEEKQLKQLEQIIYTYEHYNIWERIINKNPKNEINNPAGKNKLIK